MGSRRSRPIRELLAVVLTALGCADQRSTADPPGAAPAAANPSQQRAADGETWDVYFIQGKKVGYGHATWAAVQDNGQSLLRVQAESGLAMQRFGEAVDLQVKLSSFETRAGRLVRFNSQVNLGGTLQTTQGQVAGDVLRVATKTGGASATQEVAWPADGAGLFAAERSLAAKPMQPGEVRTLRELAAELNQPATVELRAVAVESAELLDGKRDLLRIQRTDTLPGPIAIQSTLWVDSQGRVLKSHSDTMELTSYRVPRSIAEAPDQGPAFDLARASVVLIEPPHSDLHRARRIRYRVELDNGDPATTFPNTPQQTVRSTGPHMAEIVVESGRFEGTDTKQEPKAAPAGDSDSASLPTDADRQPNAIITSDDPRVVEMAREAVGSETDPLRAALAIERYVHRRIAPDKVNFSRVFATAADVAKSLEGDCTEFAVLLTAMARASKIPSRVAVGMVFMPAGPSFGFHMWSEVFVANRWVALDGTLGQGGIGPGHLKLGDSSLAGASPYAAFLRVAQVLGHVKIKILDIE